MRKVPKCSKLNPFNNGIGRIIARVTAKVILSMPSLSSLRYVEDMLYERDIDVSHGTIRSCHMNLAGGVQSGHVAEYTDLPSWKRHEAWFNCGRLSSGNEARALWRN